MTNCLHPTSIESLTARNHDLFCPLLAFLNQFAPGVPKVKDLGYVNVTDTTIGIQWTLINQPAITGYRITVQAVGESLPILEDSLDSSTGFYAVRGLEPGVDYHINVTVLMEDSEGEPTTITQQTQAGESI